MLLFSSLGSFAKEEGVKVRSHKLRLGTKLGFAKGVQVLQIAGEPKPTIVLDIFLLNYFLCLGT